MTPIKSRGDELGNENERQIQKEQLAIHLDQMEKALVPNSESDKQIRDLLGSVRTIKDIVVNDQEKNLDQVGHLVELIKGRIRELGIEIVE